MTAEPLGENTYKITLDKTETASMPPEGNKQEMHRFICGLADRLSEEYHCNIPDGKLLAEVFLRSDGSCVFFISAMEQQSSHKPQYYSCDISGIVQLRRLCLPLAAENAICAVYCGEKSDSYRLIFTDPHPEISRLCEEFGDYCEVSTLFVARTEEYLTEIMPLGNISALAEMLGN